MQATTGETIAQDNGTNNISEAEPSIIYIRNENDVSIVQVFLLRFNTACFFVFVFVLSRLYLDTVQTKSAKCIYNL